MRYVKKHSYTIQQLLILFNYDIDLNIDLINLSYYNYQKLNEPIYKIICSEDFIREFQDKVNWHCISIYNELSEDFIREFKDKLNWHCISIYQKLSKEFKEEFKEELYLT